jgi:ferredoxin--NADP+ reductase
MSERWLAGTVLQNRHWTDALFSLRVEAPRVAFEAGQFVRIALDTVEGDPGSRVARAFSFVNPPHDPVLEFYGIVVPQGPLSPRLARLKAGDTLYVAPNPAGFLVLSELPDSATLWLLATGTGIAPFLSMIRTDAPWQRFQNVVLVHAVRHARELVYQDVIAAVRGEKKNRFDYVRMVSRETAPGTLGGRIPAALRDGSIERSVALELSASTSQVMLCGNPDMLKDTQAALGERGMRKHRRRAPGHITVESFW